MAAKKKQVKRVPVGIAGAPLTKGYTAFLSYFNYDLDRRAYSNIVKSYVNTNYSKENAKAILINPEYAYAMYSHVAAGIHWTNMGQELPEQYSHFFTFLKKFFADLIVSGKKIIRESIEAETKEKAKRVLTPQQRLARKVSDTILVALDSLEDEWLEGKTTTIDLYELFKINQLKGGAVEQVRQYIEPIHAEYKDAHDKTCEQAVEGYAHLTKKELKRRMIALEQMLTDLDSIKSAAKATRTTRVKKPKAADKQIARVKYQKEDSTYKLVSVSPLGIVGAMKLFTFNTKTRRLTYYETTATGGFEIAGTSIKNFDPDVSTSMTLRKPDEILPIVLKKTPRQITKALGELTTKPSQPNGRLNEDTILLRII
jgi:hypothetical protein